MKQRNYERKNLAKIGFLFLIGAEIIGILFLWKTKEYEYQKINGIYTDKNKITVIVTKEERKTLYKNHKLFLDDQEEKYEILEDKGVLIKNYYEISIKVKTKKNLKINDSITVAIRKRKKSLWDIIKDV